jgi:SAM-dependent methyltransferase
MSMQSRRWYEELFESGDYVRFWLGGEDLPRVSAERTQREVDFLMEALDLGPGAVVLDLCCGHGRHSIALARLGFEVTGLDLSSRHLEMARGAASEANLSVKWLRSDMRQIPTELTGVFDAVINMFTAFGYFDTEEEDQEVLLGVARSLKPGGAFFLDFINREFVIRRFTASDWEMMDETLVLHTRLFDFPSGKTRDEITVVEPDGSRRSTHTSVRFYTLRELLRMLEAAGLRFERAWGGFDGSDLTLDSRRCIVLARKVG